MPGPGATEEELLDKGEKEEGNKPSGRKYMWIGIILVIILAITVPLSLTYRSRSVEPQVTLVTLDDKLDGVEESLSEDVTSVKTDVAWVKERIADLENTVDESNDFLADIQSRLDSIEAQLTSLASVVANITTVLSTCNCTCIGG